MKTILELAVELTAAEIAASTYLNTPEGHRKALMDNIFFLSKVALDLPEYSSESNIMAQSMRSTLFSPPIQEPSGVFNVRNF
jgi:hypothetical protein